MIATLIFTLTVTTIIIVAEEHNLHKELQIIKGNDLFSNQLYQKLSQSDHNKNVIFSPISAHSSLAMAYQGAKGETAKILARILRLPDQNRTANAYDKIINDLSNLPDHNMTTFLMVNKVFIMKGNIVVENFKSVLSKQFQSEVEEVDFADSESAAQAINICINENTENRIEDLMGKGDFNARTLLVIVNAIYFKANWAQKFFTRNQVFYQNDGSHQVQVEMMHRIGRFPYREDDYLDAQVLELPYENRDLSMVIILPKSRYGIRDLEMKLAEIDLVKITGFTDEAIVDLVLPKFKIEQTIDLKDALIQLGLEVIFDQSRADFSGMVDFKHSKRISVDMIRQKTFVEVNEIGAEAVAATFIELTSEEISNSVAMIVDHPFIFMITEKKSDVPDENILLMGRINKI